MNKTKKSSSTIRTIFVKYESVVSQIPCNCHPVITRYMLNKMVGLCSTLKREFGQREGGEEGNVHGLMEMF